MTNPILYILLGLVAGITSGFIGIGGGVIIIPLLVFLFGFTQQQAQGTTLALMVPPIGLLATWLYYRQGYVNVEAAAYICIGFFVIPSCLHRLTFVVSSSRSSTYLLCACVGSSSPPQFLKPCA
jgi:uncharacterized membrane protein YfcA